MKKNKMMRLASSLLVAVLLTTSVISGTFAKYVTSGEASDSARVAKWGVVVSVTGDDAFGEKYNDAIETEGTKVVSVNADSDSADNVLAPGTNGELGSVTITGKPEVMVNVSVVGEVTLSDWLIDTDGDGEDDFYCPLVFSNGTNTVNGLAFIDNQSGLESAVEALFNKTGTNIDANTSLDTTYNSVVTWNWPYEVGTDEALKTNDLRDTALGNLPTAPKIECTVTATVTQVN